MLYHKTAANKHFVKNTVSEHAVVQWGLLEPELTTLTLDCMLQLTCEMFCIKASTKPQNVKKMSKI